MFKNQCLPLLSVLLLFISTPVLAQYDLKGKVVDQQNNPIAYANVILLKAEDSTTVLKGAATTEDGTFNIKEINSNDFVLRVSFVGYDDYFTRIRVSGDENLEAITLSESAASLGEVSINVINPSIRREVDRLVFNVENSSLSSGSTWDILRKTPMVISVNDQLQVRNQGVEVYINDRKVHLSASELKMLLENYSAENIKSVEVITNPPARYDAEGGTILNIVTSKNIAPGYKGSLNAALTQATFPKYSFGTSHYLKTDKLNLFANYSFNPRKELKEDDSYINFRDNSGVFERWDTDFDRTTHSRSHNANVMLDYLLNDRNTLSFSSTAVVSPGMTYDNNVQTDITGIGFLPSSSFTTDSELEEDQSNIGLDLEFRHLLKKEGAQISAKVHYTRYDQERLQAVATDYYGGLLTDSFFSTDAEQDINIFTGQLDYVTPLGITSLEAGVKASVIDSESGMNYYDNGGSLNEARSDNFLYDEQIFAGYASLAKDWERWSLKGGLRGEFTERQGDSRSMEQVDSREYFELFPTFYLMHSLNSKHSFSFDYSRRIQRPRYESLNPFRYFLNEHNYNAGNPNLEAAISNSFNLNYTFKGQYFFDLAYDDKGPTAQVLSFQDNEDMSIRQVSVNLLENTSLRLDFTHFRNITNFWSIYTYMSLFRDTQTFLALESGNVEVTNEVDGYFGMLANSFILSKDGSLTGDVNFTYVSDYISGSYNFDPMATLSIGVRKSLWNNRAELSLHLEDILDETNTRLTSRYLNQDNSFFAHPESRYVRVGFKYNFGNFRLSDNQRSIEAAERNRL